LRQSKLFPSLYLKSKSIKKKFQHQIDLELNEQEPKHFALSKMQVHYLILEQRLYLPKLFFLFHLNDLE